MVYSKCPFCGSMKIPKIVNYIPPKMVQCRDCHKTAIEKDFLKEEEHFTVPIQYYH